MQRGASKYDYISYRYEFPGGKIEPGESFEDALVREIKEELGVNIDVGDQYLSVEHEYPHFIITLEAYLCTSIELGNGPIDLTAHIYHQWLYPSELTQLDWAAADQPIVAKLTEQAD